MTVKIPDSLPWSANGDGAGSIQNSTGGWLTNEADINERTAYIVHACNAYPKLVEALKDILAWDERRGYLVPYKQRDPARAALKAAGAEP
ncbi:hypothetical protein [Pseudochelatococcus contaminans]|uniref:Uncharacterized protein n=1 Tax=Pseudochelatococcus contaminans TaxID=1538103 RepID=A0A7W5Z374_9HYPH|nr:hypothetical protein [Pseudochelatococcus contaminans]MBB3808801.1 hypothetical protein [Pseudochelatococcus contaminans]